MGGVPSSSFIYSKKMPAILHFFSNTRKLNYNIVGTVDQIFFFPASVGITPAVMPAAVLPPAVSAAAAFWSSARVSVAVSIVPMKGVSYKVEDKGFIFYFSQELVSIYRECVWHG